MPKDFTLVRSLDSVRDRLKIDRRLSLASCIAYLTASLACLDFGALFSLGNLGYIAIKAVLAGALAFLLKRFLASDEDSRQKAFTFLKKGLGYGTVFAYAADNANILSRYADGKLSFGLYAALFAVSAVSVALLAAMFAVLSQKALLREIGLLATIEKGKRKGREERIIPFKKTILFHILDTVDAVVQAALLVLVVNIFFIQIYRIPSESMVPTYLIKDRPLVAKPFSGPRIPLTAFRLPSLRQPSRFDIVVVRNPRYDHSNGTLVRDFVAKTVFMLSFSAINVDLDANGEPKPDPLVKRVIGLPGEKIMMVDDVVYIKKKGEGSFKKLEGDKAAVSASVFSNKSGIQTIPIDADHEAILKSLDGVRDSTDLSVLAEKVKKNLAALDAAILSRNGLLKERMRPNSEELKRVMEIMDSPSISVNRLNDYYNVVLKCIVSDSKAAAYFRGWFLSWTETEPAGLEPYKANARKLNALVKSGYLEWLLAAAQYYLASFVAQATGTDENAVKAFETENAMKAAEKRFWEIGIVYVRYFDWRNFPEYPTGDAYIPERKYFAMGDNRYNSLDCRHRLTTMSEKALDAYDPLAVAYDTELDPILIDGSDVEGFPLFTVWPPSRAGKAK